MSMLTLMSLSYSPDKRSFVSQRIHQIFALGGAPSHASHLKPEDAGAGDIKEIAPKWRLVSDKAWGPDAFPTPSSVLL